MARVHIIQLIANRFLYLYLAILDHKPNLITCEGQLENLLVTILTSWYQNEAFHRFISIRYTKKHTILYSYLEGRIDSNLKFT